jgi:hypothetical protein
VLSAGGGAGRGGDGGGGGVGGPVGDMGGGGDGGVAESGARVVGAADAGVGVGALWMGGGSVAARSRRKSRESSGRLGEVEANGKDDSSKTTWREVMTRRVDMSRHL